MPIYRHRCQQCGSDFGCARIHARHCSKRCRVYAHRRRSFFFEKSATTDHASIYSDVSGRIRDMLDEQGVPRSI